MMGSAAAAARTPPPSPRKAFPSRFQPHIPRMPTASGPIRSPQWRPARTPETGRRTPRVPRHAQTPCRRRGGGRNGGRSQHRGAAGCLVAGRIQSRARRRRRCPQAANPVGLHRTPAHEAVLALFQARQRLAPICPAGSCLRMDMRPASSSTTAPQRPPHKQVATSALPPTPLCTSPHTCHPPWGPRPG